MGGIWTAGLLSHLIDYRNKDGIVKEVVDHLRLHNTQIHPHLFDPEAMKLILDEMCGKENIFIQLYKWDWRKDGEWAMGYIKAITEGWEEFGEVRYPYELPEKHN